MSTASQPPDRESDTPPDSSTAPTAEIAERRRPPPLVFRNPQARLSLRFETRMTLGTGVAFFTGVALGIFEGGNAAGLRYRAENAHRLPNDVPGWFLYHKSKNYNAMLGGVQEGLRMGAKLGIWAGGFFLCEEAIDRMRGLRDRGDFGSSIVAGLGTAGAWSLWNRFPPITIARTGKMGLAVGLGYGLLQDALTLLQGHKLGYVEYLRHIPTRIEERRQRKISETLARWGKDEGQGT